MKRVVGAAVVAKDVLVDTDVVVDTELLVYADIVASATHTAKQKLQAPCSALLAPPELPKTCMSTPTLSLPTTCMWTPRRPLTMRCLSRRTLWPPPRKLRIRRCTRRGARSQDTVGASRTAVVATVFTGATAGASFAPAATATSSSVTAACAASATLAYCRVRVVRNPTSAGAAWDRSSMAGVREVVAGGSAAPRR